MARKHGFSLHTSILIPAIVMALLISCSEKKYPDMYNYSLSLGNTHWSGIMHDNKANRKRSGSGFNPLTNNLYPGINLFRDNFVGLNFEHIMNGAAADSDICMFTPRNDSCYVRQYSDSSASIVHKARNSSWNTDSELRYTLSGEHYIDLEFKVTLKKDVFPLGYIAFMWASYMNHTFDRRIFFPGSEGAEEKWISFGEDSVNGFETGTIAYIGTDHLPYEEGTKLLNIVEHQKKKFTLPLYYGLVHGSGQLDNQTDTMVYIMMFDQKKPIRFAMWNFIRNQEGFPDIHSPAWDWQYVIREPKINKEYGYRARVVYKPFAGRNDVIEEYDTWKR